MVNGKIFLIRLHIKLLVICSFFFLSLYSVRAIADIPETISNARFVFKGRVIALHKSITNDKDSSNCAVMRIDHIIKATANLKWTEGRNVTVRFKDISGIRVNEKLLVFSTPYLFDTTIAVKVDTFCKSLSPLWNSAVSATSDTSVMLNVLCRKYRSLVYICENHHK